jgi:hypothetical protein
MLFLWFQNFQNFSTLCYVLWIRTWVSKYAYAPSAERSKYVGSRILTYFAPLELVLVYNIGTKHFA